MSFTMLLVQGIFENTVYMELGQNDYSNRLKGRCSKPLIQSNESLKHTNERVQPKRHILMVRGNVVYMTSCV